MAFDADTVTAIVSAVGLSSIVAAAINAISNRKKTGADATKVITDAALGVVKELREQIGELQTKQEASELREQATLRRLYEHHAWDLKLAAFVNEHIPELADKLPPPPPLFLNGKDHA